MIKALSAILLFILFCFIFWILGIMHYWPLLILIALFLFLIVYYAGPKTSSYDESNEAVYEGGYPGLEDVLCGELKIIKKDLIFKDIYNDKIYFSLSVDNIKNVIIGRRDLPPAQFSRGYGAASLSNLNTIKIEYQDNNNRYSINLAARSSALLKNIENEIAKLQAGNKSNYNLL